MREYVMPDIQIGMRESFTKTITKEMENCFRDLTGDVNPLHCDDSFADLVMMSRKPRGHVCFGMLTASLYSTLAGVYLPGKYSLIHSFDELAFVKPVYAGDVLSVSGEVAEKWDELGLILVKAAIRNQEGQIVSKTKIKIKLLK